MSLEYFYYSNNYLIEAVEKLEKELQKKEQEVNKCYYKNK